MDFYPLFVFEVDDLPSPIQSVEDAVNLVKRLRKEEDENPNLPPDPRFIRLGKRLAQKLPDEEKDFWFCRPEVVLPACPKIWQPELQGTDRMERLLKVLLPLARNLHLGVFDAMFGIYVPPEIAPPLPRCDESLKYRVEFDRDFVNSKPLPKESADQYVDEILMPILAKHGFVRQQYAGRFQRRIGGGYQKISSDAMSSSYVMPTICQVGFEQHSERMLFLKTQHHNFGGALPAPEHACDELSTIFHFSLRELRRMAQPGWKNRGKWAVELALSQEDVDWIIEDTLQMGLPFVDRFRVISVDDADRFFNEPNEFTDKLFLETGGSFFEIKNATIYARLAGKRDFEAVVRRFEQFIDTHEDYSSAKKKYAEVVDICRRHLQPVNGSEPA